MHDSAMAEARKFVARLSLVSLLRVADIGALDVNGSLRPLFLGCEYVGFDISEGKSVDVVMLEPEIIPAPDASFDVIVSANCLEHTRRPWRVAREMARIARPGGWIFVLLPECQPYHAYPIDCWRAYPEGVRGLLEDAGLEVLEVYENGRDSVGIARKIA